MRVTKAKVGKKTIRLIRIGKILLMVACIGVGTGGIFLIRAEGEKVQKSRLYLEYLEEGEQLLQNGSYVNAEKSYLKAIELMPQEEYAYRQLETIYTQGQNPDAAKAIMARWEGKEQESISNTISDYTDTVAIAENNGQQETDVPETESAAAENETQPAEADTSDEINQTSTETIRVASAYGRKAIVMPDGKLQLFTEGEGETDSYVSVVDPVFYASVGRYHNAAVTKKNELYVWGANESGQVGDGSTSDQEEPVLIFSDAKTISLGDRHSAAILTNDDLYVWGKNKNGQVGDGTTKNTSDPIKVLENVREVVLSGDSSYAVTNDGILYAWGSNECGQIGNGQTANVLQPTKILENIRSVFAQGSHVAAIDESGVLYVWGNNEYGQVGNGTTENVLQPVKILDNVASYTDGWDYAAAVTEKGELYTLGYSMLGQTGNGKTDVLQKKPVKILDDVQDVSLVECRSSNK